MSVTIIGDKAIFLSKNAIIRLKKDVKEIEHNMIDCKKYIKDGFYLKYDVLDGNTNIHIMKSQETVSQVSSSNSNTTHEVEHVEEESEADVRRREMRKKLKEHLNDSKKQRTGENRRKIMSLKRSIPNNIFENYTELLGKCKLNNMPSPDEVINNVDKYRLQISAVMGKMTKVSDDPKVSNMIRKYFTSLGEFLNIEPLTLNMSQEQVHTQAQSISEMLKPKTNMMTSIKNDSDTEDEEDDEAPTLV